MHLAQVITILSDNVDYVSRELIKLENIIAFIKTSTTHHSILDSVTMRSMLSNLTVLYGRERVLNLDIREIYDIIK